VDERVEANRQMWDERVAIHVGSRFYDVDGWKAGGRNHLVGPFEAGEIGPVAGKRLLHLQCHFGMDTLTFARAGAEVVGLDFSGEAVRAADALAAEVGLSGRATFVQSTVEDGRAAVDGDFDIVYTSWGALLWLPDLAPWARTIASCLRPGGFFYIAEQHPLLGTWTWDVPTVELGQSYFRRDALEDDSSGTYADLDAPTTANRSYEWHHPLGEIVTVLAGAGLRIEMLHEHPILVWQANASMVQGDDGLWRLPGDLLPLSFSLKASKPGT